MLEKLLDFLRECTDLLKVGIVLHSYERGVVLRWGRMRRAIGPGGYHWHWPLGIEQVLHHSVVEDCVVMPEQTLTTADGEVVVLTPAVTYEVDDVEALLLRVTTLEAALASAVTGALSTLAVKSTWAQVVEEDFANDVTKKTRARAKRHGLKVVEVQFRDMTRCRTIRLIQGHPPKTSHEA